MLPQVVKSNRRTVLTQEAWLLLLLINFGHLSFAQLDTQPANHVGMAPHERAACRLPPLDSRRLSLQPSINKQLDSNQHLASQLPTSSAPLQTVSTNKPAGGLEQPPVTSLGQPAIPLGLARLSSSLTNPQQAPGQQQSVSQHGRLTQMRQLLAANNYDAYLVPSNDEHGRELVAPSDQRLRFVSNFSGSAGFALILVDRAVLFTDGRYALQADRELDCAWWLVVSNDPLADLPVWLDQQSGRSLRIAVDARLLSLAAFERLGPELRRLDSDLILLGQDLVDVVRAAEEANSGGSKDELTPVHPITVHPLAFAGNLSWPDKVQRLMDTMWTRHRARHYLVSQLDEIAWLLNMRSGEPNAQSPLFKAYLLISSTGLGPVVPSSSSASAAAVAAATTTTTTITDDTSAPIRVTLFTDLSRLDATGRNHLASGRLHKPNPIQVEFRDYKSAVAELNQMIQSGQLLGRLLLDSGANVALHVTARGHPDRLVLAQGLINQLKAVRNERELAGLRLANWRDSLAICMLLSRLEQDMDKSEGQANNNWTEISAAAELERVRTWLDLNRGQSFDTISAYGANSAVVHYRPEGDVALSNGSVYLLDTGGQYLDGTTDITRTVHFGQPSEFQREVYTRVLMGAIDMMSLVFPQPPAGHSVQKLQDLVARRHLFELGLDYAHGTGHGIGIYSLVHEEPYLLEQHQSSREMLTSNNKSASLINEPLRLQPNMLTSVEPGFYLANEFGVRLENVVATRRARPADWPELNGLRTQPERGRMFLEFEPLSLVPFEPKLIKAELLSNKQKAWLNGYHLMTRLRLSQQINHYLAKSRAYAGRQATTSAGNGTLNEPGYLNFLRARPDELAHRLELAHKWILAKTELLALDVTPASGAQRRKFTRQEVASDEAQRLLLAYMSGSPFGELEAAEAAAALGARSAPAPQHSGPTVALANGKQVAPDGSAKCSGLECELLLIQALNGQQAMGRDGRATSASSKQWPLIEDELLASGEGAWPGLGQLLQFYSAGQRSSLALVGLAFACCLALVQTLLLVFICRSRGRAISGQKSSTASMTSCRRPARATELTSVTTASMTGSSQL